MAMNKKEQAEFDRLKEELRLAKALRWTEPAAPDVNPPERYSDLAKGFLYNSYFGGMSEPRVAVACTDGICHAFGRDDQTTTQGSRSLYSTRLRALKAMRHDVEQKMAKILARIDRDIEDEQS